MALSKPKKKKKFNKFSMFKHSYGQDWEFPPSANSRVRLSDIRADSGEREGPGLDGTKEGRMAER